MVLIDRNVTLLAARVEAGPVDQGELEQLARTFNRMAESLQLRGLSGLGSGDCKSACGGPAWLACVTMQGGACVPDGYQPAMS